MFFHSYCNLPRVKSCHLTAEPYDVRTALSIVEYGLYCGPEEAISLNMGRFMSFRTTLLALFLMKSFLASYKSVLLLKTASLYFSLVRVA